MRQRFVAYIYFFVFLIFPFAIATGEQIAEGSSYEVIEISFTGPDLTPEDTPARDLEFRVRFEHESRLDSYIIHGFWDGDGSGGSSGNAFKVRFTPTAPGKWYLKQVISSDSLLDRQHEGDFIEVAWSDNPGFWQIDPHSIGQRWYMRSDDSHQYIFGNTHYSFLSGYGPDGKIPNHSIEEDIRGNAKYFKKLRFGLHGDYYPDPDVKPYFDSTGTQTDIGDYSHRPNPAWFHNRVDLAVQTANEEDLIADLILAGPDTENSRATLRAAFNDGDPEPFLKYIAARYGSYPNVWICLSNEYNIRTPEYTEREIARFGQIIRQYLPYSTPLSVHASPPVLWATAFDTLPPWNDHQIIQKKLKKMDPAADIIQQTRDNPGGQYPRHQPTINDELSYQGSGDGHNEEDSIESMLGAFLGGGYASGGYKPGSKTGQYFVGDFDPTEHTAADNLLWLRKIIDTKISFWNLEPNHRIFRNLNNDFRALAWEQTEYVLGTNSAEDDLIAILPEGSWIVTRYDIIAKEALVMARDVTGEFRFQSPDSRAVLFHFVNDSADEIRTGYNYFP